MVSNITVVSTYRIYTEKKKREATTQQKDKIQRLN